MNGIWITRLQPSRASKRIAVKDLFDTAGVRTTYGSKVFADHVPAETATAVRLLEADGYAIAGKANLHEFSFGITSQNPHYGTVPNPRFPGRTAGGSSGGSAAALVTGEAELGLGSDSGGSIRIPAACCEVVGFKPSFGRVPIDGCFPLAPSYDHVGTLAADVAGCADAAFTLAGAGPVGLDALEDVRIGVCWLEQADREVGDVVRAIAEGLAARPVAVPLPEGVFPAFQAEIADTHRDLFARHHARYGDNVRDKIADCMAVTKGQARAACDRRERYRESFVEAMAGLDLLLAPTLPVQPPPAEGSELQVRARMTELTFPLNVVGAPALAMPCGRTDAGLPVSVQVIARPGHDGLVLAASARLEERLRHTLASPETRRA
ncbi:MAG: amidase [Actinomycetota bacterium]|nr:amidase [Actinomycetota bacterium]